MPIQNVCFRFTKSTFSAQMIVVLLAMSLAGANISVLSPVINSIQTSRIPVMMLTRNQPHWSSYVEVLEWIKRNTRESDTLCSTYDSLTFLYTNRKCVRPYELNIAAGFYGQPGPLIGTVDDFVGNLKRYQVRYLIVTPQPGYAEENNAYELARAFQTTYKENVSTAFVSRDGRFFVLKIDAALYK